MNMRAHLLTAALILVPVAASADLAVSGNDGKQVRAGDGLPMTPTPDSIVTISYSSAAAPKVIGTVAVCGTILGPPLAITVAPDYSFALATCPQKIGANGKNVADDEVNVIGLDDPTHPKILQTVEAGAGATAVALSRKADVALVTGVGDDSITLFTIKDRVLTKGGAVTLEAKAEPRAVFIAKDGKTAWALRFGDGKTTKLKIDGDKLSRVADYDLGVQADGGALTADGRYLIANVFGGVPGRTAAGATVMFDTRAAKVTDVQEVGALPEHVALSPDGKFAAIVVGNGSATVKNAKNYDSVFGKLVIFAIARGKLDHVTDAALGHACQGAVWSADGKRLLVQCSVERDIRVLDFDGKALTPHPEMTLTFESRPGAMATGRGAN
jgi:DNA-binding beta-propeller fold protein YncE